MQTPGTPATSSQPTSGGLQINYRFFIAYMVGLSAFGSFVNDMFTPALPSMVRYFHTTVPTVQLALTFGMIGLAVGQFIMGPVSDKYGRKPVLIGSLILFCIAAVVSIFSRDIHFFIGCRLFQGMGAAGGYFLARTIPADIYHGRTLAKAMALIGAINGFAPASSPVIGGVVADKFQWQGIFVTLTIFAVLLLLIAPRLKETLPPALRTKGSLLKAFGDYGKLLKNYRFMVHVVLKGASLGFLFAYISSAPFVIQDHFGFTQTQYGLIIGANSIAAAAGSMIALKFRVLKKAAFIGAIGLMISAIVEASALWFCHEFLAYELLMLPILFCLGMLFTSSNSLAMNEGRTYAGAASSLLGIGGYIFGAIAAPLVGHGNILHSTAIVFVVIAFIVLVSAFLTRRIPADLDS